MKYTLALFLLRLIGRSDEAWWVAPPTAPTLPNGRKELLARDLVVGQSGWMVPWALSVTQDGSMRLDGYHSVDATRGGTVEMFVTRAPSGFIVDITQCQYQWRCGEVNYGEFRVTRLISE